MQALGCRTVKAPVPCPYHSNHPKPSQKITRKQCFTLQCLHNFVVCKAIKQGTVLAQKCELSCSKQQYFYVVASSGNILAQGCIQLQNSLRNLSVLEIGLAILSTIIRSNPKIISICPFRLPTKSGKPSRRVEHVPAVTKIVALHVARNRRITVDPTQENSS